MAACSGGTAGELEEPLDELDQPIAATTCLSEANVCSGTGDVWSSLFTVGAGASRAGEVAQTFTVTESIVPQSVRLMLRVTRPLEFGSEPSVRVAVREVSPEGVIPVSASADLVSGAVSTIGLSRDFPKPVDVSLAPVGAFTLEPGTTYALVVTLPRAGLLGEAQVGVSSHKTDVYPSVLPDGEAYGEVWRRGYAVSEGESVKAFTRAGSEDLVFSLRGSPATPFSNSRIVNATQASQINAWIGSPGQSWTLCYSKALHGASPSTFHARCDGKGPSVTLARLSTGRVIGGYLAASWAKGTAYIPDSQSFLFSITHGFRHALTRSQYAGYGRSDYGPTFGGGHDWHVNGTISGGYCNMGHSYQCRVGAAYSQECQEDFCGSINTWSIEELEVWIK